ncbi:class I SAM-dependent methyltransferase [Sphingobium sp. AR-3-1]|uniref:Class I SAM-dependent methyltransferase n=1 Tax=Sphingobium psychrophilum TaxID=2728834 RepID=A0A7X9ZVC9_9SPHN|nr:class I SAM-dependent methyltransferase [Sphingobium psychrophilum]NML12249.1 class I SAM-dependent methyltransferase [Sphingobium psychrophilum]
MDEVVLGQRGRATIDFHCAVRGAVAKLQRAVEAELSDAGINAQTMPEKMDDRHRLVDETLAHSPVYGARALLGEWTAKDHGPICQDAFAEIRDTVEPMLKALEDGPATLELDEALELPAYFERVWFHRTTGGWDASPHNGFVHGELIHKRILTRVFGGNIFGHRRTAAAKAPPRAYRRILDMGASSGHNMVALAEAFPDAQISGVDFSARMLEQARRVANARGWAWKLYQRPCEATGFADGSFDLVSSYNLIHEIPPRIIRAVFAEAYRLLEPGGTVIMSDVPRYADLDRMASWRFDWAARWGGEPYWRAASTTDLVAVAQEAGFVDVDGGVLPGGQPYILVARKPEAA